MGKMPIVIKSQEFALQEFQTYLSKKKRLFSMKNMSLTHGVVPSERSGIYGLS